MFAQEGAAVVPAARREERLAALVDELRDKGAEAAYVVADVTSAEDAAGMVASAAGRYGRPDAAFNSAGTGGDRTPLHEMSDEVYDTLMDTNARGAFNRLRAEIAAMLKHGGAIVDNSSVGGLVAIPTAAPYVASKHAVVGLTRAAADEYARHGIRVDAVAPGTTRSEITDDWFARNPGLETWSTP
ncbi:hypothetical protein GCM10010421_12460 [Streptomyces glaucus]|uniref:Uncharacterized protein n=1 Tax=Streptomyces glaucus TaxID=284029 RepID=A0ABN3JE60_9ACTN